MHIYMSGEEPDKSRTCRGWSLPQWMLKKWVGERTIQLGKRDQAEEPRSRGTGWGKPHPYSRVELSHCRHFLLEGHESDSKEVTRWPHFWRPLRRARGLSRLSSLG